MKWVGLIATVLWMSVTIYVAFIDVDPDQFGFKSSEVEARMRTCGGTFQQRYDCKEAIILAKQHDSFLLWLKNVAWIIGPPMALAILFRLLNRDRGRTDSDYFARPPTPVSKRRVR